MHVTAILICEQLPIAFAYRGVLIFGVVVAFIWNASVYLRRTPRRVHWSPQEGWILTDRRGKATAVELLPEVYLSQWLVLAHFKDGNGKRHTAMLAQDSVLPDSFRRIKILLSYQTPRK